MRVFLVALGVALADDHLASSLAFDDDIAGLQLLQMQVKAHRARGAKEAVVVSESSEETNSDSGAVQTENLVGEEAQEANVVAEDSSATTNVSESSGSNMITDASEGSEVSTGNTELNVVNTSEGDAVSPMEGQASMALENVTEVEDQASMALENVTEVATENQTVDTAAPQNGEISQNSEPVQTVAKEGSAQKLPKLVPGHELIFKISPLNAELSTKISLLAGDDVPLRLVLRDNKVSINSREGGMWGHKERHEVSLRRGREAEVLVQCSHKSFRVLINGEKIAHHRYHLPLSSIKAYLIDGNIKINSVRVKQSQQVQQKAAPRARGRRSNQEETCPYTPGMKSCGDFNAKSTRKQNRNRGGRNRKRGRGYH